MAWGSVRISLARDGPGRIRSLPQRRCIPTAHCSETWQGRTELAAHRGECQQLSFLYSTARPIFYSAVYNLIGSALCFKEYYKGALHAHSCAYIAALEAGDPWSM